MNQVRSDIITDFKLIVSYKKNQIYIKMRVDEKNLMNT